MAQQLINNGASAGDPTAENLYDAFAKVNANDTELYGWVDQAVKTTSSPQFTAVNIGHASDTTLARVSAGVASIEGKTIALLSAAQTWSAAQAFNDTTLTLNGATSGTGTLKAPAVASTYAWTLPAVTGTLGAINFAQTWSAEQTFVERTDTVYTITDAAGFEIDPVNGKIQKVTLGANRTPQATNLATGQAVHLMVDDGTAYTITWTHSSFNSGAGPTWIRNSGSASAPTLATTGWTHISLFNVGGTIFGMSAKP